LKQIRSLDKILYFCNSNRNDFTTQDDDDERKKRMNSVD